MDHRLHQGTRNLKKKSKTNGGKSRRGRGTPQADQMNEEIWEERKWAKRLTRRSKGGKSLRKSLQLAPTNARMGNRLKRGKGTNEPPTTGGELQWTVTVAGVERVLEKGGGSRTIADFDAPPDQKSGTDRQTGGGGKLRRTWVKSKTRGGNSCVEDFGRRLGGHTGRIQGVAKGRVKRGFIS